MGEKKRKNTHSPVNISIATYHNAWFIIIIIIIIVSALPLLLFTLTQLERLIAGVGLACAFVAETSIWKQRGRQKGHVMNWGCAESSCFIMELFLSSLWLNSNVLTEFSESKMADSDDMKNIDHFSIVQEWMKHS